MLYLESFGQSELWEEMDFREFCKQINESDFTTFDDSEKSKLEGTFSRFHNSYFTVTTSNNNLFDSSSFRYNTRASFNLHNDRNNILSGLIYASGGRGEAYREFFIGKLDDEYYLVEYRTYRKGEQQSKYFKCDQLDGFLALLGSFTNRLKKRDFEKERQNHERDGKIRRIVSRLKSMTFDQFIAFYDEFMK